MIYPPIQKMCWTLCCGLVFIIIQAPFCSSFLQRATTPMLSSPPRSRRVTPSEPRRWYPQLDSDDAATTAGTISYSNSATALFGIPKMFRWLTDQYPNIINNRLTEGLSPDTEVDNFYLDMNGIIHPCTHGNNEAELVFLDETAMFKKIFLYVDRLYKMVKPSKVLYLAVDGVAPRAKMNQQRSRRFRSAKEAEQLAADVLAKEQYMAAKDGRAMAPPSEKTRFDSNCITPGTDFMLKLSLALQKWVAFKMENDPFWKDGAQVIVSGPDVEGEGEHKVMDFIRESKSLYDNGGPEKTDHYAPGWTHVLYGLDADLIMLGLVTHEPNFMLLREKMSVVMAGRGRNKYRKKKDMMEYDRNDFELLELSALRQLLAIQFRKFSDEISGYSLDRIIDDFVFMCILVGNDFLPHCPHLEIDAGAISLMMTNYIELLPEWGGYLTDKEKINPERFEQFVYNLAAYEEEHFKRRGYDENEPGWKLPADNEQDDNDFYGAYYSGTPTPAAAVPANVKGNEPPAAKEIKMIQDDENLSSKDDPEGNTGNRPFRRRHPGNQSRSYRDFYYESKMGWPVAERDRTLFQRRAHVRDYLEGLHWVLNYYHNGCPSWDWYFPHLYSPLATDMVNLGEFYTEENGDAETCFAEYKAFPFEQGTPFPSLAQLLSVLPPQSAALLPEPLAELMMHPSSPLIPYYPPDFTSDPNGKRQPWEAVVDLPFIEAGVLLDTVNTVLDQDKKDGAALLTPAERRRNVRGTDHVFVPPGLGSDSNGQTRTTGAATSGGKESKKTATPKGQMKNTKGAAPKKRAAKSGSPKKGATKGRPKKVVKATE